MILPALLLNPNPLILALANPPLSLILLFDLLTPILLVLSKNQLKRILLQFFVLIEHLIDCYAQKLLRSMKKALWVFSIRCLTPGSP
jgi:hypothetical protein